MTLSGNLRQYHPSDILRLIGDGLRRGRLVVERGGFRADLYCENGYLIHVWRNGSMPSLAQQWLSSGLLAAASLTSITAQTNVDPAALSDSQFVQLAVESGAVSSDQLAAWAMNDAVALLNVLFSWGDGDFLFEEGPVPPPGRLRVPLPIPLVLGTLMQRSASWQVVHPDVPAVALTDVLEFTDIAVDLPQPIQLTREQWQVLTLVDGQSSLMTIALELANRSGVQAEIDQQRYAVEVRRYEALVLRAASELVAKDIAVPHTANTLARR